MLTPGTPLELLCDARGTPQPNITWHKDGQALNRPKDRKRAGRVLRVEGVQVLLPRLLWDEAGLEKRLLFLSCCPRRLSFSQ